MRFRWTLFGREITTIEFGDGSGDLAEILAGLVGDEVVGGDVTGGPSQNFERDGRPADPNDRYRYEDRFGFNGTR